MKFTTAMLASLSFIGEAKLVLNEVSDAGTSGTCANADWIELLNIPSGGDGDLDLEGYMLCDSKGCDHKDAYTFPKGSIIKSGEHKVVCRDDGVGFAFGIGGDDTVKLQDKIGSIVDIAGPLPDKGAAEITWARIADGTGDFKYTAKPTPGAPNVDREPPRMLDCASSYSTLSTGDICQITWANLMAGAHRMLPTESSVGHAWVIRQLYDDFTTEADATKWLSSHEFPVVLHEGNFYLTDRHHHALALQASGHADKMTLILKVVCDYQSVNTESFWNEMVANNYALAYEWSDDAPEALPGLVNFSAMPRTWDMGAFGDNQWRSLAGFASSDKWTGWAEDERCYVQECEYFIDFAWAYLFTESATQKNDKWPAGAKTTPDQFLKSLRALPRKLSIQDYDADAWHTLAGQLLPLCHDPAVNNYPLPKFFPSEVLKGWSTVPLPTDPDCLPQLCGATAVIV